MNKKEDENLITHIFAVKYLFDRTVASNSSHFFLPKSKQTYSISSMFVESSFDKC